MVTDAQIIDLLGGTSRVAHDIKVDMRVVSNWRRADRKISAAGRYKIQILAAHLKIKLPKNFMDR